MKIMGFIKWQLAKVSLFNVFFFWSASIWLCVFESTEIAKYHMAAWISGMIVLLLIVIVRETKSSYHRYLTEQRALLDMLNDKTD